MKSSKGFCEIGFLLCWLVSQVSFGVTCPAPEKVSGSLGHFNQSERETADFVDRAPGQDDIPIPNQPPQVGIKFRARPDCDSSQYFNQRGCPAHSLDKTVFNHVVLNRFCSGDSGTVWCYYKTPNNTMISVNMSEASGRTCRIARPAGAGWRSDRFMSRCDAVDIENCSFEFQEGRLPSALFLQ